MASLEEQLLQGKKELEALKKRHDALKTKAAVDQSKLEQARAIAREQVQTDDVDQLRAETRRISAENEAVVKEFLEKLANIKAILEAVEQSSQEVK